MSQRLPPTIDAYVAMQQAYDFFNARLFEGALAPCMLTFQRVTKSYGHFSKRKFVNMARQVVDEVSLNPAYFGARAVDEVMGTLVHEMCHQYINAFTDDPGRRGYHNKNWADKMKSIGLHPSSTGLPGGKEVGEKVSHYIVADGPFHRACKEFLKSHPGLVWFDLNIPNDPKSGINREPAAYREPVTASQDGAAPPSTAEGSAPIAPGIVEGADGVEKLGIEGEDGKLSITAASLVAAPLTQRAITNPDLPFAMNPLPKKGSRIKYTCGGGCRINIWGSTKVNATCNICSTLFVRSDDQSDSDHDPQKRGDEAGASDHPPEPPEGNPVPHDAASSEQVQAAELMP